MHLLIKLGQLQILVCLHNANEIYANEYNNTLNLNITQKFSLTF